MEYARRVLHYRFVTAMRPREADERTMIVKVGSRVCRPGRMRDLLATATSEEMDPVGW